MIKDKIPQEHLDAVEEEQPFGIKMEDFYKLLEDEEGDAYYLLSVALQLAQMDEKEWARYLEIAADKGSLGAMEQLADFLMMDEDEDDLFEYNPTKAIELYKKLVPYGNLRALYVLGIYYLTDDSPEWNPKLGIEYLQKVGDEADSLCEYVADNFEAMGQYEKAIHYYKKAKWVDVDGECVSDVDEEDIMVDMYPNISYNYYEMHDYVNALKYANKGITYNPKFKYCHYLKGLVFLEQENISGAIDSFTSASALDEPNACYQLGLIYKDNNYGVEDKGKALYFFEKAKDLGVACSFSIDSIKNELHYSKEEEYSKYLNYIIEEKIPIELYPNVVKKDLEKDFGNYWEYLSPFTKTVLITGITSLIAFMNCEKNSDISLDYSSVIISISRALERELKTVFYDKFIEYLELKGVNASEYCRLDKFVYKNEYEFYEYSKSATWFTLGKLKVMVNKREKVNKLTDEYYTSIDYNLRNYCMDYAFKKEMFPQKAFDRRTQIVDYVCELANQSDDIAQNYRNEAAHTSSTSSLERARSCIDWILKVKQLLLKFIEKIDYEKINNMK